MITCYLCNAPLSGGLDTFDTPETPLCVNCWLEMAQERVALDKQFGEAMRAFNEAYARKDWDAADAAYHRRYENITDTPVGFRRLYEISH